MDFDPATQKTVDILLGLSKETPSAPPASLISCDVMFWTRETATVEFFDDGGAKEDPKTIDYVAAIVPFYFARIMANLGDDRSALGLRDRMKSVAELLLLLTDGEDPEEIIARHLPLPEGFVQVPRQDGEPIALYRSKLIANHTIRNPYAALAEYTPIGDEGYFAPASVIHLANTVAACQLPRWAQRTWALAVQSLCGFYESGPTSWSNAEHLVEDPNWAFSKYKYETQHPDQG